jgi:hypothetical protein
MPPLVRSLLALLAAVLAASAVIGGVEALNGRLFPPPADFSFTDPVRLEQYMRSLPTTAFLVILAGYAVGAAVAGGVASRLAPSHPGRHAAIAGGILVAATLANVRSIPHPVAFEVASLALPIPCALLAHRLLGRSATR